MNPKLLFGMAVLFASTANGQLSTSAAVNSTGGAFIQGSFRLEWSVGEMALVHTMEGSANNIKLTNGLLQPFFIFHTTDEQFSADEIKLLPNPTYNTTELYVATRQQGMLHLHVYDAQGKQLVYKKRQYNGRGMAEKIDLTSYTHGTYIITIALDPFAGSVKKWGSYKIIKL